MNRVKLKMNGTILMCLLRGGIAAAVLSLAAPASGEQTSLGGLSAVNLIFAVNDGGGTGGCEQPTLKKLGVDTDVLKREAELRLRESGLRLIDEPPLLTYSLSACPDFVLIKLEL